ncbi:glycerophosphodiester phosphodiesterase family protein [Aurantibacter sp.]|uniref:glycerophosphodiester phosphodiesterase n=1 Tax=Aurantibacter sp. TaxID=2807103 RepID=UPI003263424F
MRFLSCFLILVSLLFYSASIVAQSNKLPKKGICAHRGAMEHHPENTIAAFKEAIRLGAQMIEFDVRLTKDKRLVVIHDDTLGRTTNGVGKVKKATFNQIRELDAGSWKSEEFSAEKVPTLKEVLQIMPKTVWLNIHLKGNKELGIKTAKMVVAENRIEQSIIACSKKPYKGVKEVSTAIKTCNMQRLSSRSKYIDKTIKKSIPYLQIKSSRDNDKLVSDVQRLKENGVGINYYHAENETRIIELLDAGVDFILTNHLSEMMDVFKKYSAKQSENQP